MQIDPEGIETQALRAATAWKGTRVLEIGCGDGRLARRLVRLGAEVVASDPDREIVKEALSTRPKSYRDRMQLCIAEGEHLPFPPQAFEIVVFGLSL